MEGFWGLEWSYDFECGKTLVTVWVLAKAGIRNTNVHIITNVQ